MVHPVHFGSIQIMLRTVLFDLFCKIIKHEFQNNALYILHLSLKYAEISILVTTRSLEIRDLDETVEKEEVVSAL